MHHYPYSFSPKLMIHETIFTPIVEKKGQKRLKDKQTDLFVLVATLQEQRKKKVFFLKKSLTRKTDRRNVLQRRAAMVYLL
jgi:hypothetical protein